MNNLRVPYVRCYNQHVNDVSLAKESRPMQEVYRSRMFINYVHSLFREYGKYEGDYFTLFASDLPLYEKKIFLSHLIYPSDYEDYTSSSERTNAAIEEYLPEMQMCIDNEHDDFYHEWTKTYGLDQWPYPEQINEGV